MIEIILNGEKRSVLEGTKLAELVGAARLEKGRVACEVNQSIVRRADYESTVLQSGDAVEIVQMIGGG